MNLSPLKPIDNRTPTKYGASPTNELLDGLPEPLQDRLSAYCDRIPLRPGERLFGGQEPLAHLYFPESGAIGLLMPDTAGHRLQVGLIDRHGMAGFPLIDTAPGLPCEAVAQLPGAAIRMRLDGLPLALQDAAVQRILFRYLNRLVVNSMQLAVCNAFHTVEQRLARWLLRLNDVAGPEFDVTQHVLATMLGVRRPSVTLAALALQDRGAIAYRYGHMQIRHRPALETSSCGCYAVMQKR
jgi:CRP-like cAMP-binding protein